MIKLFKSKSGLAESFTGKLILMLLVLIVALAIYAMLSGKFSRIGTGMEWLI